MAFVLGQGRRTILLFCRNNFVQHTLYEVIREQSLDELLRKAAYYFKESGDYENSIAYYMKLISHCFAYSNYSQVILFVEELKKFPNKYLKTEILKIALIYSIKSHEVLNP